MQGSASSGIGRPIAELDTPALLLDLDGLDRNIATMAETCRAAGIGWRPHVKSIRVPAIAHRALAAGAIGVTCAKVSEAAAMVQGGVGEVLIANQVVSAGKIARIAALARQAHVIACVDAAENVRDLDAAAALAGVRLSVAIEVEIGMARAGALPGEPCLALARLISESPHLHFAGLAAWEGHTASILDPAEKAKAVAIALTTLVKVADDCRAAGFPCDIVNCGGTATYRIGAHHPGITEIQAGGGIFGDLRGRDRYGLDHACALTVLSTVISRPTKTRIICDAGKKAVSIESALPEFRGLSASHRLRFSAEHTTIELDEADDTLRPGDLLEFEVGYADTTVHLHDRIFAHRGGLVEAIWSIPARGQDV